MTNNGANQNTNAVEVLTLTDNIYCRSVSAPVDNLEDEYINNCNNFYKKPEEGKILFTEESIHVPPSILQRIVPELDEIDANAPTVPFASQKTSVIVADEREKCVNVPSPSTMGYNILKSSTVGYNMNERSGSVTSTSMNAYYFDSYERSPGHSSMDSNLSNSVPYYNSSSDEALAQQRDRARSLSTDTNSSTGSPLARSYASDSVGNSPAYSDSSDNVVPSNP